MEDATSERFRALSALTGLPSGFEALFRAAPSPFLVLAPAGYIIIAVNDAYLRATMTERAVILGRGLFEVFPDNPDDPSADGTRKLRASLERVVAERRVDEMTVTRYAIPRPAAVGGGFEERWWRPRNAPVLGPDGAIVCIIHHVEDVTAAVRVEAVRRQGEIQRAFLLKLSDALRPLADPAEIQATAARALGEELRANRAFYAEVRGEEWLVTSGYENGVEAQAVGRHPMAQFGRWIVELFRGGQPLVIRDLHADARFDPSQRAAHAAYRILGAVAIPLVKEGTPAPRSWRRCPRRGTASPPSRPSTSCSTSRAPSPRWIWQPTRAGSSVVSPRSTMRADASVHRWRARASPSIWHAPFRSGCC